MSKPPRSALLTFATILTLFACNSSGSSSASSDVPIPSPGSEIATVNSSTQNENPRGEIDPSDPPPAPDATVDDPKPPLSAPTVPPEPTPKTADLGAPRSPTPTPTVPPAILIAEADPLPPPPAEAPTAPTTEEGALPAPPTPAAPLAAAPPDTHWLSVKDLGAIGDGVADDTAAFATAIASSTAILIPPGTYRVDTLRPKKPGITIRADGATIRCRTPTAPLFVTSGSTGNHRLVGGTYSTCDSLWVHEGDSALYASHFEHLGLINMHTPFRLSSAVGVTWRGVQFYQSVGGIDFEGTGGGGENTNVIDRCVFMELTGPAIRFGGKAQKVNNEIQRSWFEEIQGTAIIVGATTQHLRITENYFEDIHGATSVDIDLDDKAMNILIDRNWFGPVAADVTARIRNRGTSGFSAVDNAAVLKAGQVLAEVGGKNVHDVRLERNWISGADGQYIPYSDRLFRRVASAQQITWSVNVNSGYSTGDDFPREVFAGQKIPHVYALAAGPEPSVRAGHLFLTDAKTPTLTNLTDGMLGQTIQLAATANVTIQPGTALRLRQMEPFLMRGGDTLTLTMFQSGIWMEVGRSVNQP